MSRLVAGVVLLVVTALVLTFNNCSKVEFSSGSSSGSTGTTSGGGGGSQKVTVSAPSAAVDILLVIDNSASMTNELTHLGSKFGSLADTLTNSGVADWQMCFTTTEGDEPVQIPGQPVKPPAGAVIKWSDGQKVLSASSTNYVTTFQNSISIAGTGANFEQPIKSANKAFMLSNSINSGCFRPGVAKSVLIITDEDELNDGWLPPLPGEIASDLNPTTLNYPQSLVDTAKVRFGASTVLNVNAIAIKNGDRSCLDSQRTLAGVYNNKAGYYARRITELVNLTLGKIHSICLADYTPSMTEIARTIAKALSSVDLPCTGSGVTINSINYVNSTHPGRTHSVSGYKLTFNPGLTGNEQAQIDFTCN